MKLIFHIVRKDAARIRWLWLAWLGVLAAKLGLALCLALGGIDRLNALPAPGPSLLILNALDAALVYLLAAWIMLEDAPMNDRHFARTRPVSRGTLLAAKIVGALTLFWLPAVAVWLPWWIYCGFTAGDICAEAAMTLAGTMLPVLPAFLVASLVDSFRRVLLWTPVWMGALIIAVPLPFMWMLSRSVGARGPRDNLDLLGLWQSRFLLAGAALVGGTALLLVWQFFRRKPRETAVALAAGFAVIWAIVLHAPWNFWPDRGDWAETHPERARGVEPELVSARLKPGGALQLGWRANMPPDSALWPMRTALRLSDKNGVLDDGERWHATRRDDSPLIWTRLDFGASPSRPIEQPPTAWLGPIYGESLPYWSEESFLLYAWPSYRAIVRNDDAPLRLQGRMLLAQVEYRVPRPQPVAPGILHSSEGRKIRIVDTVQDAQGIEVSGFYTRREEPCQRRWAEFFAPLAFRRAQESLDGDGLALIDGWNRKRKPVMNLRWWNHPSWSSLYAGGSATEPTLGGVKMRRFQLSAFPPTILKNGRPSQEPVTDEWLAGLRLVAVERRETARFLRDVTVDRLQITADGDPGRD